LPFSLNHPPRTRAQVEVTLPLVQKVVTGYEVSTKDQTAHHCLGTTRGPQFEECTPSG
jgi:hypothetical protein